MTFKQRLPYFLGGLTIGIIIVTFIFNKKNTTFEYGPNARVLKNLRTKERIISKEAISTLSFYNLDTAAISKILTYGDVDLLNKVKLDTCLYQYTIQGKQELENVSITIKNCDSTIYIEKIILK
ncbi:DUF4258 domain-containing protein [Lutibacter sp. HS1-25]|uniref:DUF4258 domain-containing protein n=1 Tax=Lutibacter sp. HS1-25 TaxID=2485000 RepID=UPI0010110A0D|nr:DUF4258 domain-containing protein [Lutibacter sp. HS1-25]RXP57086.1 DUF4258 domain-containing protein [Lutibacter sp. HS1-25]